MVGGRALGALGGLCFIDVTSTIGRGGGSAFDSCKAGDADSVGSPWPGAKL
jgi:hypothetical protein